MTQIYNDPAGGSASSIGPQIRTDHFYKKALIEARKKQYFSQLSRTIGLPKHAGKKITRFQYLPLLDDGNVNNMGLDAAGSVIADGNLYGSSKDVGLIPSKMPTLTENGGRVNRVGTTRIKQEGTIQRFGFFTEYTDESMDFDSDAEREGHLTREMINAAVEMSEDLLQLDLIQGAGLIRYAGAAVSNATVAPAHIVTYNDLVRLSVDLDNNRVPKHTKVITGTRLVDTKTIAGARVMYVGSELVVTLKSMVDNFGNAAFVPVQQYAAGTSTLEGEIGAVDQFRIVVVPEMMKWEGAGVAGDGSTYETGGNVDVLPMLVVGDESFSTIGFQTDGKTVKFNIIHKKPGKGIADQNNPYGTKGFMSIQWWYGTLIERAERLALVKTAGKA